jgi:hypothetical protein
MMAYCTHGSIRLKDINILADPCSIDASVGMDVFPENHQIADARTTHTPSGSGTKNAPNTASAAGVFIW